MQLSLLEKLNKQRSVDEWIVCASARKKLGIACALILGLRGYVNLGSPEMAVGYQSGAVLPLPPK